MITKLKNLKKILEKDSSGCMTISKELYDLLVSEKDKIDKLFRLIETKRSNSVLRVLLGNLLSEQIDEFFVPEMGLSRKTLISILSLFDEEYRGIEYDGRIAKYLSEQDYVRIRRILNKGQVFPKRLEAFEKKPKGSVISYEFLENCYLNEFFKFIECNTDEEIIQNITPSTMNLIQIDWLYKHNKLFKKDHYATFVLINGKIILMNVDSNDGKTFYWHPSNPEKGRKLLFFSPQDFLDKDKWI